MGTEKKNCLKVIVSIQVNFFLSSIFNKNPSKRRRLDLLHPETKSDVHYDKSVVNYTASSHRIDYDALTQEFVRTCQINGGNTVSNF